MPARVHDVLSAFYYVRTCPLPDGGSISIPTHDNEKSYEMVVKVLRRERIEVPAGKVDEALQQQMGGMMGGLKIPGL